MRANHLLEYGLLVENAFVDTYGNTWFNLKAVGVVLGMAKRSVYNASTRGWFSSADIKDFGRKKGGKFISQPALYNLLMRCQSYLAGYFRKDLDQAEIQHIRHELRAKAKEAVKEAKKEHKQFIQASFMDIIPNPYIDLASTCIYA